MCVCVCMCVCMCVCVCAHVHACLVTHSCLTLCDLLDCSPPGFSVHGIFQARILEWVSISSSRRSSWFRDQTHVCIYIHTHLLYPFISWWTLRFLHILTIVNNIATNIGVHLSFWITGVFFSDIYTGVEMLGHMVVHFFCCFFEKLPCCFPQ